MFFAGKLKHSSMEGFVLTVLLFFWQTSVKSLIVEDIVWGKVRVPSIAEGMAVGNDKYI